VDAVLFLFGDIGVVHCMNIDEKLDSYEGLLEQYTLSCEVVNRPANLFARIDRNLQNLEVKPKGSIDAEPFPHAKTIEETLTKVENELTEIEGNIKPLVDALASYSKIIRRIDLLLASWKINIKRLAVDGKLLHESKSEMVQEADQKLFELETRFSEIESLLKRSSKITSKIDNVIKKLKINSKEFPNNGISCSVNEKFMDFMEQTLLSLEEKIETQNFSAYSVARQLMNMKANIKKIIEKIPEEKIEVVKQTLKLRKLAELERQAIKSEPEFSIAKTKLLSLRVLIEEVEELRKIGGHMGSIENTVYLEAWVPKNCLNKVIEGIKQVTEGKYIIKEESPTPQEKVPTMLKPAPKFLEAFEKLTFSFGYPKPDEINPVFIMAITFPLLFGIMFADVGQGTILVVGGLVLSYFRRRIKTEEVGDIIRYLLVGSGLIILCGISSIFFGFLFGEFFGPSGIIHPISLGEIGPFHIGGFDPMLEPVSMLRLSIFVGVALLSFSLILRIVNNVRNSEFRRALISVAWVWLLLGGFTLWVYWGGISNLTRWFGEGIFMFIALIVLPVLIMIITTATTESLMSGIQFSTEILIESLDHTISFGRLAALSLTHSALNYMFLILGGAGHSYFSLQSIPIIMVGTILALTIEGLIIFVHTLRLHWVEWLPSFYSGKGIPFKPIKLNNIPTEQSTHGS
jgi:vacuolar-type H+-ATPase subunit I/STV1